MGNAHSCFRKIFPTGNGIIFVWEGFCQNREEALCVLVLSVIFACLKAFGSKSCRERDNLKATDGLSPLRRDEEDTVGLEVRRARQEH